MSPAQAFRQAAEEMLPHLPAAPADFARRFAAESQVELGRNQDAYLDLTGEHVFPQTLHSRRIAGFKILAAYEVNAPKLFAHVVARLQVTLPPGTRVPQVFSRGAAHQAGMNLINSGRWSQATQLRKVLHGRPEVVRELGDLAESPDWEVDPKPAISLGGVRAEGALGRFVVEVLGMVRARGRSR